MTFARWLLAGCFVAMALTGCSRAGASAEPACATAGADGCRCRTVDAGEGCDPGLACNSGRCAPLRSATLSVSDPTARGCEVVLLEGRSSVKDVVFDDSLKGSFVRDGSRLNLSWVSSEDEPIHAAAIRVTLAGDLSGISVPNASCLDGDLNEIARNPVKLTP